MASRLRALLLFALGACSTNAASAGSALRLTEDSDPAAPRLNLVQWNWTRQLAADEAGGVHAVWTQWSSANIDAPADRPDPVDLASLVEGQVFYRRSADGGRTWGAPVALTERARGTDSAAVVCAGSRVYALWRAAEGGRLRAFVRGSTDGGRTWGAPAALSDNPAGVSISPPALAASPVGADGRLYAVWADGRPQSVGGRSVSVKEVYLSASDDGGASWSAARPVSSVDGFSSWTPALAVWNASVHVAWTDERDDVGECTLGSNPCREEEYYRRSTDGGATFGPELRLTRDPPGSPAESWAPSLSVWDASVHLSYLDRRTGAFQVYYQRSTDGGATFGPEQRIASDPRYVNAARPTVAARAGAVHLSWFGFTDFEADVYYGRSADDGATWAPWRSLTAGPEAVGAARMPHVAAGPNGAAHVLWYDTRFSDARGPRVELFYARPGG